jgi:hypothetical protein
MLILNPDISPPKVVGPTLSVNSVAKPIDPKF